MNHEEFINKLKEIDLPLIKILLKQKPFEEWPEHLKQDAYKRVGYYPQTVYLLSNPQ